MADSDEGRTLIEGVITKRKVIPDHQLADFHRLSDDAIHLFRITLVVIGIYASLFAVLMQIGSEAIVAAVRNSIIALGSMSLLLSLGGSFASYLWARGSTTNVIKSSEYIHLSSKYKAVDDSELDEEGMVYKYYWKKAAETGSSLRVTRYMVAISSFFVYVGVIYTPMGLLSFYIRFPGWATTIALYGPLVVIAVLAFVKEIFNGYEGVVHREIDEEEVLSDE